MNLTIPPGVGIFFLVIGIMLIVWLYSLVKNATCSCQKTENIDIETDSRILEYASAWFYKIEPTPKMETCPICLNDNRENTKIAKLACGHEFHESCVTRWLEENLESGCPLCRAPCTIEAT